MSRVKTFDSTGVAPGGFLYAGDLNVIQDQYADITNLSQAVSVGSLAVGESGLALSRYSAGVMRLSGQLRVDTVVNALTGFQQNGVALAASHLSDGVTGTGAIVKASGATFTGSPNVPTAAPGDNSQKAASTAFVAAAVATVGAAALPAGVILPYGGAAAPAGFLLCQGQAISRTTYAALFAAIGSNYGAGDGSTTFNVPDFRRKIPVGLDAATPFNALGNTGGEETHALTVAELASHSHTMNAVSAGTPTGTVVAASAGTPSGTIHDTFFGSGGALAEAHVSTSTTGALAGDANAGNALIQSTFTGTAMAAHGHTFTGNAMPTHNHTINSTGSGNGHNNLQPYVVVNYIVKT